MVRDVEWYRRNAEERHPLHFQVGELFSELLRECSLTEQGYSLVFDMACGGAQRVPLFISSDKSRKTWFCDVDLLVTKEEAVKAIVEIEESNVKPVQVFGKFLASAVSKFYLHDSVGEAMRFDTDVAFIQFVDSSKLKRGKSSKVDQWRNIGNSIRAVVPLKDSRVTRYDLYDVDVESVKTDKRQELKNGILGLIS